ncbi:MAG: hypothetical protein HETSPECPRED_000703 [Heterodermia speciosa]|uniref:Rhodopsin domain-containing protein n=1 Tax=Heterodermia speciosa TaxID=116794 RepID=A0A8H3G7E7_9LECA|nr:MAG: hypothetical protein HETSPECPRED_000703 [Heterodermia speciosa]
MLGSQHAAEEVALDIEVYDAVAQGAGKHAYEINLLNIPKIQKGFLAAEVTWMAANTSIKISILHFYLTLFRPSKSFRLITFTIMGLTSLFCLAVVLDTFLICRPLAKSWNPLLPGTCGSLIDSIIWTSIINVLIDTSIILLPMPMVWALQMARWRKYALTFTFALGGIVCGITITRVILAKRLDIHDFTYDLAKIAIVTDLEPLLGIIAACAPLFPTTIKAVLQRGHKSAGSGAHTSSLAGMNGESARKTRLRSYDAVYPLNDLEVGVHGTHITSPGRHPRVSLEGDTAYLEGGADSQPTINVKREWEVRTN